jgi:NaMN:DMB phosphoribosyltransferase
VEGSLADVVTAARGIHRSAVIGTVAAWSARYCPITFAGDVPSAAALAFSALRGQVREIERSAKALESVK